jgi:hypothetical protein
MTEPYIIAWFVISLLLALTVADQIRRRRCICDRPQHPNAACPKHGPVGPVLRFEPWMRTIR